MCAYAVCLCRLAGLICLGICHLAHHLPLIRNVAKDHYHHIQWFSGYRCWACEDSEFCWGELRVCAEARTSGLCDFQRR